MLGCSLWVCGAPAVPALRMRLESRTAVSAATRQLKLIGSAQWVRTQRKAKGKTRPRRHVRRRARRFGVKPPLLDTHVWLWWLLGQPELAAPEREALDALAAAGHPPALSSIIRVPT